MGRTPNLQQQSVIDDLENNIILFASAGTGKTFTVANRIEQILRTTDAAPAEILCLTFTNKACAELQEDIAQYVGEPSRDVVIKTIHGFCLHVLQQEAKKRSDYYTAIDVCDDVDEGNILLELLNKNAGLWQLRRAISQKELPLSEEELYALDRAVSGEKWFWVLNTEDEPQYIGPGGKRYLPRTAEGFTLPEKCPACGKPLEDPSAFYCGSCELDLRRYVPEAEFVLAKKAPQRLREIVSRLKHVRYERNYYSGDEAADFDKTIKFLRSAGTLAELFSFFDREKRREKLDEALMEFFCSFGGRYLSAYQTFLRQNNRMDYDDLILETGQLLKDEAVCADWAGKYKYITVDEMQDTTSIEYSILKKIFASNHIMLCGDFFQTIYEWRGSDPEWVLDDYIRSFHAETYMFSENYRSTHTLARTSFRYLKNTYPDWIGKYCPEELVIKSPEIGEPILCKTFDCDDDREKAYEDEARFIFDSIVDHMPEDPTSVCVMARSNAYIARLAEYFDKFNEEDPARQLSFFTVERNQAFFKTPVVKDMLALLRILLNPSDTLSMDRVAEKFINGVGARTIEKFRECAPVGVDSAAFLAADTYEYGDNYHTLIRAVEDGTVVVYDTETTGLDQSRDQILQLAAIRYNAGGEIVDTFEEIIIPTVEVSAGARAVIPFDIDAEVRRRGRPAAEVLREFHAFTKGAVLIGHNSAGFDDPLLSRELRDLGLPPLEIVGTYDTMTMAKRFCAKAKNYKLATLCDWFGVENEDAHNALGDVKATGAVLFAMLRENILPSQAERSAILRKYRTRFENFYRYYTARRQYVFTGQISVLADDLIAACRLETKYKTEASKRAIRDVRQLLAVEPANGEDFLQDFLTNASLSGSQMDLLIKKLKQIPIITVHQSKGCEFDTVYLAGVDDSNFPSYAAVKSGGEEEEKRVFYVAISRAKKKLVLTRCIRWYFSYGEWNKDYSPSPYFFLLFDRVWKPGSREAAYRCGSKTYSERELRQGQDRCGNDILLEYDAQS